MTTDLCVPTLVNTSFIPLQARNGNPGLCYDDFYAINQYIRWFVVFSKEQIENWKMQKHFILDLRFDIMILGRDEDLQLRDELMKFLSSCTKMMLMYTERGKIIERFFHFCALFRIDGKLQRRLFVRTLTQFVSFCFSVEETEAYATATDDVVLMTSSDSGKIYCVFAKTNTHLRQKDVPDLICVGNAPTAVFIPTRIVQNLFDYPGKS